jgi:hypothetical protein
VLEMNGGHRYPFTPEPAMLSMKFR